MPKLSNYRSQMRKQHRIAYANFTLERDRLMKALVLGNNPAREVMVAMGTLAVFDKHGEPMEEYTPSGNCKRYLAPLYGLFDEARDMFGPGIYGDPVKFTTDHPKPVHDW